MLPITFWNTYKDFAKKVTEETKVPFCSILTRTAIESGWGEKQVNNNFFGIKSFKDTDKRALVTTTEWHEDDKQKYPSIIKIEWRADKNKFRYTVKDWFMVYDTPYESFLDFANFLKRNIRYKKAFDYCNDDIMFTTEICKAGYATSPDSLKLSLSVLNTISGFANYKPKTKK